MSHSTQHNQKQVTSSSLASKSNHRRSSSERALIEQILSSHKKVYGADEVEFIPKLIDKHFGKDKLNLFLKGVFNI